MARALREALRHDYGPERSKEFYGECESRLATIADAIEVGPDMTPTEVADQLKALASVGSRVALLERSHLGEFSWPFAEAIREFAEKLFSNEEATGLSLPIVHVVAEGIGYHIWDDDPERMFRRRIMIVAFPRHLRHHVLLHSIFGHELGHPALKSDQTMGVLFGEVLPKIRRGPLQDPVQLQHWLRRPEAPPQVQQQAQELQISDDQLRDWGFEFVCDLFGLMLFGPAFAASHRMILEPLCAPPEDYVFKSATHPPYPLRKRLLADAMRLLGWMEPTIAEEGPHRAAEEAMLAYAGGDVSPEWNRLVEDDLLREILNAMAKIFEPFPGLAYSRAAGATTQELLERLTKCRPPIAQSLDRNNVPRNERVPIQHCLYAGWAFWFGKDGLREPQLELRPDTPKLDFVQVNRLCEQALLQQRAIDAMARDAL